MKQDLKGYHHYHKAQMDNAEPAGANAPEQHAASAASEAAPETSQAPARDYVYEPGQEPGATPFLGDLNCELDMPDLLSSSAEQLCKRCQELEEQHLRTLADMDNFKKRLTREKEEQARFAAESVLADILPALDNFELALNYGRNNDACADLITGLDLAQKSLLETLARHGLVTVDLDGETYVITDIGMRMLEPRELARAMGFPEDFRFVDAAGKPLTKRDTVKMIGNACPVNTVAALVKAVVLQRPVAFGLVEVA